MFHVDIVGSSFTHTNISTFGVPKKLDIVIYILTTWASIPHPKVHQLSDCTQNTLMCIFLSPRTCYHARACPCTRKFAKSINRVDVKPHRIRISPVQLNHVFPVPPTSTSAMVTINECPYFHLAKS
jgi:hypothetical protein